MQVSKATFLPAKPSKFLAIPGVEVDAITLDFPNVPPSHKEKRRYSQSDTYFKAVVDQALQERIQRIGMSVVPAYQKTLPDNDPSKIKFRFYAVDSDVQRWEVCGIDGLILLPRPVLDRLKTDDQLAAILADGVALDLQRQAVRITNANRAVLGAETAGDIAGVFVPGLNLAAIVGSGVYENRLFIAMRKQRSRIALALLNDAGYDLQQAPEAWRLLEPKKLPKDLDTLKNPDQSNDEWNGIYQQYRNRPPDANTVSALHSLVLLY